MQIKYKTKVSLFIYILFISISVAAIIAAISSPHWSMWIISLLTIAFLVFSYYQTYYTIDTEKETLQIKAGIGFKKTLSIKEIRKIEDTRTLISAPALSQQRIEIYYAKYDSIVISPENKLAFIACLKKIQPNLIYMDKKSKN